MRLPQMPSIALIRRELITSMREPRTYGFLGAIVFFAGVFAVIFWPEGNKLLSEAARYSRELVRGVAAVLFVSCALFVPAFAANSLALERERDTYPLLRMTLIHSRGIVFGKLMNTVGFFIFLTVATLPVFGVAFFLVGIDPWELFELVSLLLMGTVTYALIGIAVSSRARQVFLAIALSYVAIAALLLVMPLLLTFFWVIVTAIALQVMPVKTPFPEMLWFLQVSSPVATIVGVLTGDLTAVAFWLSLVSQAATAFVCFHVAVVSLHHHAEPMKRLPPRPIDDPDLLEARRKQFPYYLIDPMRRKKMIEDGRNPMLVKELRWGLLSRGTILVRLFYGALMVYFVLGVNGFLDSRDYDSMFFWLMSQIVVTVLIAPALLSNTLTKEREQGNIDMLRVTLLTPRDIVLGKLAAGALSASPLLMAAFCSGLLGLSMIGLKQWGMFVTGYGTLLVSCYLCFSISIAASLMTQRTTNAVVISYALNFIAFYGLCGLANSIEYYIYYSHHSTNTGAALVVDYARLRHFAALLSPITAFVENANSADKTGHLAGIEPITLYWLSNVALFTLIATFLTWISIATYRRLHMQDR